MVRLNYKRFPIDYNGQNFTTFQWLQWQAEPWALPVFWEWVWLQSPAFPGQFPDWREKGWVTPLRRSDDWSEYTRVGLHENPDISYHMRWYSEVVQPQRVQTSVKLLPALHNNFDAFQEPNNWTMLVGDPGPPAWAINWNLTLVYEWRGQIQRGSWLFIPHSECWEPDFEP